MKELIDVDEIQAQIIAFANGDFTRRIPVSDEMNSRDSLIEGINMLGEELEATTISRDYFESVYDAVSDLLLVTDDCFKIVRANKIACQKLCKSEKELVGIDPRSFIKIHPKVISGSANVQDSEHTSATFETTISTEPGNDIVLRCNINKLANKRSINVGYLVIGTDITREKLVENKTLSLILTAQEEERLRLANDLHDSLGQELNAVMMYIQSLRNMDRNTDEFVQSYRECVQTLEKAIEEIRDISFDLMPKALQYKNLGLAILELCTKVRRFKQISHNLCNEPSGLSKMTEKVVYRICQEFITNSIRHAPDSLMEIKLYRSSNKIHFELADKGPGFDLAKLERKNGLLNINTRLEALGAEYHWNTSSGTKLLFSMIYEEN